MKASIAVGFHLYALPGQITHLFSVTQNHAEPSPDHRCFRIFMEDNALHDSRRSQTKYHFLEPMF